MDITANWHWPQWALLVSMLFTLIVHAVKHGQPKDENHNGFVGLIEFGLLLFILTCGGFFK